MITTRDGEYCRGCGVLKKERQLILDHIDNNSKNNDLQNLQILCRRCNYLKNPRPLNNCESEYESENIPNEICINRTKEPQFKRFVAQRINESEYIPERDLINSSAERLGLSPITTKRYLDKICSSDGIYQRIKIGNTLAIAYKNTLDFV